jgi:hypothetical protein
METALFQKTQFVPEFSFGGGLVFAEMAGKIIWHGFLFGGGVPHPKNPEGGFFDLPTRGR